MNAFKLIFNNHEYTCSDLNKIDCNKIDCNNESSIVIAPLDKPIACVASVINTFVDNKTLLLSMDKKPLECKNINTNIALLIATSGSQAQAKYVKLSRANIQAHCHSFSQMLPIHSDAKWLNCLPLQHIAGLMIIYRCYFSQASVVLHQGFDAAKVWLDIGLQLISHISLVPRMLFKLLQVSKGQNVPNTLKYVIVGGDALSKSLYHQAKTAGWPIWLSYGMTELCSTIALSEHRGDLQCLPGIDCQQTEQGILQIKGKMLFQGYVGDEKQGDHLDHEAWFNTHDKVDISNNKLTILGRSDDMIIAGGKNIAPQWLESLIAKALNNNHISELSSMNFVIARYRQDDSVDVLNDPNSAWGDTIVLVCQQLNFNALGNLAKQLQYSLEKNYWPRIYISIETINRTKMGKVKRSDMSCVIKKVMDQTDQQLDSPHLRFLKYNR